jgi:diguanylate cyclase (GGDEF)-like protein
MADKIAFIICEHYAKEAQNALAAEGIENAVTAVFPARCGRPPLTIEELTAIIAPLGVVKHVEVFGASCLSGLADITINGYSIHLHKLEQCFNLIADQTLIDNCLKNGAYLTTPGWLAIWPDNIKKMGLDQETAREMFAETTTSIVLLDTGLDEKSTEHLQAFAAYVDRPYKIFYTGISVLRLLLARTILTWQMDVQKKKSVAEIKNLQKQSAMHAMAIDLLSNLARIVDEEHAIEAMMDVYTMLFAPQRVCYLSYHDGLPDKLLIKPPISDAHEIETIKNNLEGFYQESSYTESGKGFILRIVRRGEVRGVIAVEEIALPEYIDQYLNLALGIVNICELPVENARKYQKLIVTEEMLRKANEDLFKLATTDSLTGIANRRAYDEYIEIEWKRMLRDHSSLSLIMCDIDFFKNYNDLHGHKGGDICLHTVAQIIRQVTSRPGDFAARYGGEEFVVVLPNTSIEGTLHIAEEIRKAVVQYGIPHKASEIAPFVTLSLGVAEIKSQNVNDMSHADLFRTADAALYEAKQQGRNRVIYKKNVVQL